MWSICRHCGNLIGRECREAGRDAVTQIYHKDCCVSKENGGGGSYLKYCKLESFVRIVLSTVPRDARLFISLMMLSR